MIICEYWELKRVKELRLRRIGFYGLLLFGSGLLLSYLVTGDLDTALMSISEIIALRILCMVGIVASSLVLWKGPRLVEGLRPINNNKGLERELGEVAKNFEKIMRGEWG
jgi:multisubunit Na+/H+ antiporter MnhB subunit